MTEQPNAADLTLGYYKQKLAAAQDEAARFYAEANLQAQRADAAEAKLAEAADATEPNE